jgi:hypothetical protein
MVFPIGDDNTGRVRTPYITYLLIALNVLVFVTLQGMGTNERFTYAFSTVPEEIRTGTDIARPVRVEIGDQAETIPLQPTPGPVYMTLVAAIFMHGSLMHLLCCFSGSSATTSRTTSGMAGIPPFISSPAFWPRLRTWFRPSRSATTRTSRASARQARSRA